MDDKERSKIQTLGALNYSIEQCSIIMGTDVNSIKDFNKYYEQGIVMFNFAIDSKLLSMARDGDIKSLDKLEQRKRISKFSK